MQCLQNGRSIYFDTENDLEPGYYWSGLLAMTRKGFSLTCNGYTRRCAYHYMKQLKEAQVSYEKHYEGL